MGKLAIKTTKHRPSQKDLELISNVIIVLPKNNQKDWPTFAYADLLKNRCNKQKIKDLTSNFLNTHLPNKIGSFTTLVGLPENQSSFARLTLCRKIVSLHLSKRPSQLAIIYPDSKDSNAVNSLEAFVATFLAQTHQTPSFKSKAGKRSARPKITVYGMSKLPNLSQTIAAATGNNLARDLTIMPPNKLDPGAYQQRISELAEENDWQMTVYSETKLKQKGANAFLAVCQGSSKRDNAIIHLEYQPDNHSKTKTPLVLVGKGICFDTGGVNLKPAKFMAGMHEDMQGSAVALGTMLAFSSLKVNFPVHCWLAIAQNHIGPNAYKPDDVITAYNGTTIEIVHTDAEGRMVLADTLSLASEKTPGFIIDYATLTGACVYSLSTRYSGVFSNRESINPTLIEAGKSSGERVWPFPVDKDFDKDLESKIADIKQCTLSGDADHILAARFLSRFVDKKCPWIHIDLASGNHKGGLGHINTDVTGIGVRYTLDLIMNQKALEQTH